MSTLSEAGSQKLVYFIKFATFFTRDALGNWCPSENIRKINELVQNRADNIDYFLPLSFWADWLTLNILLDGNALESHICPRQGHKLLELLPFSPRISLDYSSSGMFVDPI